MMNQGHSFLHADVSSRQPGNEGHAARVEGVGQSDSSHDPAKVARCETRKDASNLPARISKPQQEGKKVGMNGDSEVHAPLFVKGDSLSHKVDSLHGYAGSGKAASLVDGDFKGDLHPVGRTTEAAAPGKLFSYLGNIAICEFGLTWWPVSGNVIGNSTTGIALRVSPLNGFPHNPAKNLDVVKRGVAAHRFFAPRLNLAFPPMNKINHVLITQKPGDANFSFGKKETQVLPRPEIACERFGRVAVTAKNPAVNPNRERLPVVALAGGDAACAALSRKGVGFQFGCRIVDGVAGRLAHTLARFCRSVRDVVSVPASSLINRNTLHGSRR